MQHNASLLLAPTSHEGQDRGEEGHRRSLTVKSAVDVLIVNDQDWIGLAELLRTFGYSVKVTIDGEVALRLLQYLDVGLVIFDMEEQAAEGPSLLEALHPGLPVVILSSVTLSDDELERIGSKVIIQLQKPVEPHHLVRVVAATLGSS